MRKGEKVRTIRGWERRRLTTIGKTIHTAESKPDSTSFIATATEDPLTSLRCANTLLSSVKTKVCSDSTSTWYPNGADATRRTQ